MQAGKLGLVADGWIEDPRRAQYKTAETRPVGVEEEEFVRMLSVKDSTQATLSTIGNTDVYEGTALFDEERELEKWYAGGEVAKKEETEVRHRTGTEWAAVPQTNGHDGFALVSTGKGTFAFTQLANHQPVCEIAPAYIDLRAFLEDKRDNLVLWEIGTDPMMDGTKSISWSSEPMDDAAINDAISDQAVITLDATYDDVYRRVSLAQSGWIELYEPEMETAEFVEFVSEEVLPYAFLADSDTDASSKVVSQLTEAGDVQLTDENQTSWDDLDTVNVSEGGE